MLSLQLFQTVRAAPALDVVELVIEILLEDDKLEADDAVETDDESGGWSLEIVDTVLKDDVT